ncbi:hypothetical protein AB832_05915 [Flavobacteriaceae bacterium (ex Bugula neritina AB1)]|nr:hypothetical protein AB832_05915 [Flavobacteriaceae bacterium (ex Bugula neritina AB1)]
MLNTYYKDLNKENKQFAVHRIASRIDIAESVVKKVLESFNPLMEIQENRVVVNRNSYNRLVQKIYKENTSI